MTTEEKLKSFELLKQKVEATFQQQVLSCQESIHEWKGKQISEFQETLSNTVGGYVSEKWFYTHLKVIKNEKLPRIDMLNLLARYVGTASWDDFVVQHPTKIPIEKKHTSTKQTIAKPWLVLGGFVLIGALFLFLSFFRSTTIYRFCIVDKDNGTAIDYTTIQAFLIHKQESPSELTIDSTGCVLVPSNNKTSIELAIKALYYHPITVKRSLDNIKQQESIQLKKDDYALMIHYFSTNKMADWNKRRTQLSMMLSDDVRIIQLHDKTGGGMALYNKEEFINKMTLPIKSLKNINILETKYEGTQIVEIRFVQTNH